MHKGFVATVLCFWIIVIGYFFKELAEYATLNHLGVIDTLKMFDMHIQQKILSYGIIAPILFVVVYTLRPLVFFPASIMTITSVFIFGPFEGFVVSYVGEIFSACLAFYVGKYFGHELGVTRKMMKTPIGPYFQGNAFLSVFVLRIVPLFPFDFVNYSAGLLKIPFKKYFWATVLGVIPGLAVFIFLGNSLVHKELLPTAIASAIAVILVGLWMKEKYEVKAL